MRNKREGQALIVALLVVVVITTIVLALISRTVVDVDLSSTSERSSRAFSAADAGIEDLLQKATDPSYTIVNGEAGQVGEMEWEFTQQEAGATPNTAFVWPRALVQDEVAQVIFSADDEFVGSLDTACTGLKLYWGTESALGVVPAIETIFIYDSGGYQVKRYVFDPDTSGRIALNNFSPAVAADETINTTVFSDPMIFKYNATVSMSDFPSGSLKLMRMKLLYNGSKAHFIAVLPIGCSLVNQAEGGAAGVIKARSAVGDLSETISKRLFISRPVLPSIFDYVLFSGGSIQKLSN